MSARARWVVFAILAGGLLLAALIPSGRYCPAGSDRARQWSYRQEMWFHGCFSDREPRGFGSMPMDAGTDSRIPLRIGVAVGAILVAWVVATAARRRVASASPVLPDWFIVAVFAVVGAASAFVLSIRQESKCIRTTPGHASCGYKSFVGWNTEPLMVDGGWVIVGLATGIASGLVITRRTSGAIEGRSVEARVVGAP